MPKPKTGIEPLDQYCEGVRSGEIVVCKFVRQAVERHYRDLERQDNEDFPYYFDEGACRHYVEVFENEFQHYEGVIAGNPIVFEPWQWFSFGSIFGWLKKELFHGHPIRRFRKAYIIIPKKNGKSIISGGTGIYMMDFDMWPGAQCYIMAKSVKHAKDLGYRAATSFVEKNRNLMDKYKINLSAADAGVYFKGNNNAFYKPITAKVEGEDGRNVHFFGPDETKDWEDTEIYDLMVNGTVNAPNSLVMSTTTAGPNEDSLGYEQQKYLEDILSGTIEDDTVFGVIYTIDEEDMLGENGKKDEFYYENPELWKKANPNYDVSVYKEALEAMLPEARKSVSKRIAFCTKHLNQWFSNVSTFIKPEVWNACDKRDIPPLFKGFNSIVGVDSEERERKIGELYEKVFSSYRGCVAYGGLDLGSVSDFTAFVLSIWMEETQDWDQIPLFWIPDGTLSDRKNIHLITPWIKQGYIQTTPGQTTDYNFVEYCIKKISEYVDLREIWLDRSKADPIINNLQDHFGDEFMVKFGQGYMSMKDAVDAFEKLALEEKLNFGGNPVLKWMNGNTITRMDPAGNRKFDKEKSKDKIDGIVAEAMSIFAAHLNEGESGSVYNERGAVGF